MTQHRRLRWGAVWLVLLMALGFALPLAAQDDTSDDGPPTDGPALVVLVGSLQDDLGCPTEWDPACETTALPYDTVDEKYRATFRLPAGDYEYKVALDGGWAQNYGAGAVLDGPNIALSLAEDADVTFIFDPVTGWVADSVNHLIASVPGSYQAEIGCPGAWQPDCLQSWLQDADGDGVYTFVTTLIPAGDYEAKAAINESWALNYGADGARDGANIAFSVPVSFAQVTFAFDSATNVMTVSVDENIIGEGRPRGAAIFLARPRAHWVAEDAILWDVEFSPANRYELVGSEDGTLSISEDEGVSGDTVALRLREFPRAFTPELQARFPHLARARFTVFRVNPNDVGQVAGILRMQHALVARDNQGRVLAATTLQVPGVLDALYADAALDAALGATFDTDGVPTLRVWAPTARAVSVALSPASDTATADAEVFAMTRDDASGVWSVTGDASWVGQYYQYVVDVYVPNEGGYVTNRVTDPYSVSLSTNSTHTHLVPLDDPALVPANWDALEKPPLETFNDVVLYELHIRDFSVSDPAVPEELVGTFRAFTVGDSFGMTHLRALAASGVTHLHLLPVFDIATINEDAAQRVVPPTFEELRSYSPASPRPYELLDAIRDQDEFNWGYDPFHYTVPEGSYSTDPEGGQRVLEFREMVQALNESGLRVVMDVVYNHTNSSGQEPRSVLDRIVPGYYHRLSLEGEVATSTCCPNTATEHAMMRKLMVDSVVTWVTAYQVDGFRFDLMGHHMVDDMLAVRAALDALTIEADGVDGARILIYGEGWNFGEVENNARGVNATQRNLAGTGIGTFNDRVRDALRGGNPFGGEREQGFATGLATDANGLTPGDEAAQQQRLLLFSDQIRVALAGNLAAFTFESATGDTVTGADIDYNGSPAGYNAQPQEHVAYAAAHDNETLWDKVLFAAPPDATTADRVRMNNMALSVVALSQGMPFFHAGDELLRSKSFDGNSYNSGDWFNRLDFTYTENGWGGGLPPSRISNWDTIALLLDDARLAVTREDILAANAHLQEMLQIRTSSVLFRLRTAEDIQQRLTFHNTGPQQTPGLIVMHLDDTGADVLDAAHSQIIVLFNQAPEAVTFAAPEAIAGGAFTLHPVQQASADAVVRAATYDDGVFTVPGRTTAVFVVMR